MTKFIHKGFTMNETLNSIVNNLSDRFGEVVEATKPIVDGVASVSQTVVLETATTGFVATMCGVGIFSLSIVGFLTIRWALSNVDDKGMREVVVGWSIAGTLLSLVVGVILTMFNIGNWLAPTKNVILEVVGKLQ